jgi:hypothetical protein
MLLTSPRPKTRDEQITLALRLAAVGLTLTTAVIHLSLGGMLFLLNAAGYATLAAALVVPGSFAERFRWAPRLALVGYAAATIVGWVIMGPRYDMAYLAKGIEIALIAVLVLDIVRAYGGPTGLVRRIASDLSHLRTAAAGA